MDKYNINKDSISIFGNSGGTLQASTLAYELAIRNESNLCKTVFLEIPMIFSEYDSGPYDGKNKIRDDTAK